ncbi:MAG: TIGR04255 family protein [Pseudomonadota bacterium]|nr:TIGR04255 family protein [Pseudomonadota bacterium]
MSLAFVVSKVQYAPIPESTFQKAVSSIQEQLRKKYPNISSRQKVQVVDVELNAEADEQSVSKQTFLRIAMASADLSWCVQIMPTDLMLLTTSYESFEDFYGRVDEILEIASEALDITHTGFVGIRYINKFELDPETDSFPSIGRQEFLQPSILDFKMGGSNLSARYKTQEGWLNLNSGVSINSPSLLPDLHSLIAEWKPNNDVGMGAWAHVDIDSFASSDGLKEFDREYVMNTLKQLRKYAKDAYNSIVSE